MKNALMIGIAAGCIVATSAAAGMMEKSVFTHPSQGDVVEVENTKASLISGQDGVHISLHTKDLIPGNVYTYWLVAFNEPGKCEADVCTGKDALIRTETVESDAGYVGGSIVGDDGSLRMTAYQPVGELRGSFFGRGILETSDLELHLILQDHGPAIDGRELEMLTTYRGGCSDDSIPPPFPETARVQGDPGPNQCRMVQVAIFPPQ